ncbi:MAG: tRNA (guanine(10)-N(2))-dimethyltransferase [Methanomicrobiales archaeon]|nr:tRNA (guanine(10)-N(2))-dimethyltransferase [Methanomicrobiales archaeon]
MELRKVREGTTEISVPVVDESVPFPPASVPVFYNPRMELNRDATVLLLFVLKPATYLDAMGGTGIRGLRAANECGIAVTVNDHNPLAVELIRKNAEQAGISAEITWQDVNVLGSSRSFEAVDLDPFGSPAFFLDSMIRSARRYLFITATDTAPLCGAHLKAGMRRYLSRPLNTEYHSEVALRTLLGFACRETVKYDRGVVPLFCYVRSHYVRIHLEVRPGTKAADRSLGHIGYIHHCTTCTFRIEQPGIVAESISCPECGGTMKAIGPLWLGAICDKSCIARMQEALPSLTLGAKTELHRLLSVCSEELDISWHYEYHQLAKSLGISPPGIEQVITFLHQEGFRASRAHYSGTALKTDAPIDVLIRAIRR